MNTHPTHQVIHDTPPAPAGVDPDLVNEYGAYRSTIVASSYIGGVTSDGEEHDWWALLVLRPFAPHFAVLIVDPDTDSVIRDDSERRVYWNIGEAVLGYVKVGGESPAIENLQLRAAHPAPSPQGGTRSSGPTSGSRLALGLALGIAAGGGS